MSDQAPVVPSGFKLAKRGYDPAEVDAHVAALRAEIEELRAAASSPQGAVRQALDRLGEEVAGILEQAHQRAAEIAQQSRREAEQRLELAHRAAAEIAGNAEAQRDRLELESGHLWAQRERIVSDARELARRLLELANAAASGDLGAADLGAGDPGSGEGAV
jgi:DivIVA domain-containing protein